MKLTKVGLWPCPEAFGVEAVEFFFNHQLLGVVLTEQMSNKENTCWNFIKFVNEVSDLC